MPIVLGLEERSQSYAVLENTKSRRKLDKYIIVK
jgi:hypothetical protein